MIDRYWTPEMKNLFKTNTTKFTCWLIIENAVLTALVQQGRVDQEAFRKINQRTWVDDLVTSAIERRDKVINHDLNAFIEIMRLQILLPRQECVAIFNMEDGKTFDDAVTRGLAATEDAALASLFHDGMTSYDTEEPAMSILLSQACDVVWHDLQELHMALTERAEQHRGQPMVGRTHGQHAQPTTFGIKLLGYRDMVSRAMDRFAKVEFNEVKAMKLSGAVGVFGTLPPDVEKSVGAQLGLTPVIATQILSLERRARVVNELAIIACILEKIARDLWHMATTEVGEIREPFGKKQKGSSAMPHKKNPITLEKIYGLASVVRGCAAAVMENVATSHERDISHSSVERLSLVDAFATVDHMLQSLTKIVAGMEVFPDRMRKNLDLTQGTIASQRVEMLLKKNGMPAEAAYRSIQEACFAARDTERPLLDVLKSDLTTRPFITPAVEQCFDWATWIAEEDFIYEREGIKKES